MNMKDPAFLFYPGDYLRDTQCLSTNVQVAYDRIMCEHMRNICITQQQLKFFTKKLTEDEKEELLMVIDKVDGGYEISWVAASIRKRRAYSESRRKNRLKKTTKKTKTHDKHMLSHDEHMENENEIVNENRNETKKRGSGGKEIVMPWNSDKFDEAWANWKEYKRAEHGFKFKSKQSEQASLVKLSNMANDEQEAVKMINEAMAQGWKGFYKLKNEHNDEVEKIGATPIANLRAAKEIMRQRREAAGRVADVG